MKLMNIADEGAQYKWQLYDLYDKAFQSRKKATPGYGTAGC